MEGSVQNQVTLGDVCTVSAAMSNETSLSPHKAHSKVSCHGFQVLPYIASCSSKQKHMLPPTLCTFGNLY